MAAKVFDTYVEGLNDVLKAFRQLPKEASKELRQASKIIAERHMAPAWRDAALGAGPWGEQIAASVKAASDRIPAVKIGGNRKVFSGGATATMVRWPSSTGTARDSFAPFEATNWLQDVRSYHGPALQEWAQAVDRIVAKWSTI